MQNFYLGSLVLLVQSNIKQIKELEIIIRTFHYIIYYLFNDWFKILEIENMHIKFIILSQTGIINITATIVNIGASSHGIKFIGPNSYSCFALLSSETWRTLLFTLIEERWLVLLGLLDSLRFLNGLSLVSITKFTFSKIWNNPDDSGSSLCRGHF